MAENVVRQYRESDEHFRLRQLKAAHWRRRVGSTADFDRVDDYVWHDVVRGAKILAVFQGRDDWEEYIFVAMDAYAKLTGKNNR